nr:Lrp/AsnC ligand binding domain-containing protein [Kordiimonas marina]
MDVTAFIFVKLKRQDAQTLQSFRENLSEQRQVIRMASLSGEFDFMLEFVGRCVAELNDFRSNYLNACDLIKGTTTLISLE